MSKSPVMFVQQRNKEPNRSFFCSTQHAWEFKNWLKRHGIVRGKLVT